MHQHANPNFSQSVTRKVVAGEDIKAFSSGKAAFRFLVPRQKVLDNPAAAHLVAEGYLTLWYGDDRRLVMYPCNDNTMMNFVAIHPSGLSASKGEGGVSSTLICQPGLPADL